MEENMKRILVVDDEQDLCEILKFNLETEGYEVETANSAEEALEMDIASFDLLLLDVMMGGMSGFQLAKQLKGNPMTANVPIIFLTARDTENDTVTGFNIGADDYISKPFSIREVMVRVRAVLRRTAEQAGDADESKIINYQGLQLNLDKKTVSIDGEAIPFTKTEFELLRLFLEERGKVFSRQELIDRVWPKDVAKKSSIQRNLKRQKLVEKYAAKKAELKKVLADPSVSDEEFFAAQRKLCSIPRNASKIRIRNRCSITGRPRGFIRKFGLSRITFRELALDGKLPGVTKSSW